MAQIKFISTFVLNCIFRARKCFLICNPNLLLQTELTTSCLTLHRTIECSFHCNRFEKLMSFSVLLLSRIEFLILRLSSYAILLAA